MKAGLPNSGFSAISSADFLAEVHYRVADFDSLDEIFA